MALPVDTDLTSRNASPADGRGLDDITQGMGPMPPEQPLAMPMQDLRQWVENRPRSTPTSTTRLARLVTFGGAVLLTIFGGHATFQAITTDQMTTLQALLVTLFIVNFAWIAFATCSAIAGALIPSPTAPPPMAGKHPRTSKTALVMPVYNEDPLATTAALQAMGEALAEAGADDSIEILILSDSTEPDAWVRETIAFSRLHTALDGALPVWYRRRWRNVARKAGNIEEFVERWGGRYDFMIVLECRQPDVGGYHLDADPGDGGGRRISASCRPCRR